MVDESAVSIDDIGTVSLSDAQLFYVIAQDIVGRRIDQEHADQNTDKLATRAGDGYSDGDSLTATRPVSDNVCESCSWFCESCSR